MNSSVKKDRELFSVKPKKTKKSKLVRDVEADSDDERYDEEQVAEIQKLQEQTHKFRESLSKRKVVADGKFTYQMLAPGTVLPACVTRVRTECIIVSLPFRMMGHIPLTDISKEYTLVSCKVAENDTGDVDSFHTLPALYAEGQYISVSVTSNENKKSADRLTPGASLSLFPADVNRNVDAASLHNGAILQCAVVSVEDHGYVLDSGVKGVKAAFLPSHHAPTDYIIDVGSVLQCVISGIHGTGNALSLIASALPSDITASASKSSTLRVPGTTVDCVVVKSMASGLVVFIGSEQEYEELMDSGENVLAGSVGHICKQHLRGPFDQPHVFRQGQKLQAKVLFNTDFPKICYLTLSKTVMCYTLPSDFDPKYGLKVKEVLHEASVFSTTPQGLFVRLSDKCLGFCHYKKLNETTDLKPKRLMKKYPVGTKVTCKLAAFNYIDQIFLLNMKPGAIKEAEKENEPALKLEDKLSVEVLAYENGGVKVRTTKSGILGYVWDVHVTDSVFKNSEKQIPLGTVRDARVIEIRQRNVGENRVLFNYYFSFKSRFVDSDVPLLTEYSEEKIDCLAIAVVCHIIPKCVFLVFGQNVRGFIPVSELPSGSIPSEMYKVGDAIKVKLVRLTTDAKPSYCCSLPGVKKRGKRTQTFTAEEIPLKRQKIVEQNRKNQTWVSVLKQTLNIANRSPPKEAAETDCAKSPVKKNKTKKKKKKSL